MSNDLEALELSAQKGNAYSQYLLGWYYETGLGAAPQNTAEACKWYRKAAEQGNANAQDNLKRLEQMGPVDASAQFRLGWKCANGEGVPQNDAEACRWYRKAAEQGNPNAQCNLGTAYRRGKGVRLDHEKALFYYGQACDNGSNEGCEQYALLKQGKTSLKTSAIDMFGDIGKFFNKL